MDHRRAVQGISARAAQARAGLDLGEAVPAGLAGVDPVEVALAP